MKYIGRSLLFASVLGPFGLPRIEELLEPPPKEFVVDGVRRVSLVARVRDGREWEICCPEAELGWPGDVPDAYEFAFTNQENHG